MKAEYDIAIIGGGMVGASLAVALTEIARRHSLKVVVFESFPLPQSGEDNLQPSYDARATALSYGSRNLLDQMGVWESLRHQVSPIQRIKVSDRGHFGAVRLDARNEGVPALGYVVENRWLGSVLIQRLKNEQESPVELCCPAQVIQAEPQGNGVQLQVETEGETRSVFCRLVVMADGGRSPLREQLAIDYETRDYDQHALVCNLTLDRPHGKVAYERFTASGPMALLPLTNTPEGQPRSALIWSVPDERIDNYLSCSDDDFLARLQTQFGYRAGRFIAVGERFSYPLQLSRVREQVRQGIAVLGNAAHTLHPIAGQGFNLALRGAMVLADELALAAAEGRELGTMDTLGRFEQSLQWDQEKTIGFSDQVTRLFSQNSSPAVIARNLGLLALDLSPPAKQWFAESAMGLDYPAPELVGQ